MSALEVLAANDVVAMIDSADRYTPTPAVSHAILTYNRGRTEALADGIVVTPSHNPPATAASSTTRPTAAPPTPTPPTQSPSAPTRFCATAARSVKRVPLARALQSAQRHDYMDAYVDDLPNVVDVDAIRKAEASGSAPTRSAGPASTTGPRSPSGTTST